MGECGREALGDAASGSKQLGSSSAPDLVAHLGTPLANKADKVLKPITVPLRGKSVVPLLYSRHGLQDSSGGLASGAEGEVVLVATQGTVTSGDQDNWMVRCCADLAEHLNCAQAERWELDGELAALRAAAAAAPAQVQQPWVVEKMPEAWRAQACLCLTVTLLYKGTNACLPLTQLDPVPCAASGGQARLL